jgi:hypothetical protein
VLPRAEPLRQPERVARYRFSFRKAGDARWLSHRNVMDLLERALRAAAVPVRYTEGYNPHIRLSMGPALSLGYEALAEQFDVECHATVEIGMLSRANRVLPDGLELTGCERLPEGAASLGKTIAAGRFRLRRLPGMAPWPESPAALGALAPGVLDWRLDGGDLVATLNVRPGDGPTPGVKALFAALGVPEAVRTLVPVIREALVHQPQRGAVVA